MYNFCTLFDANYLYRGLALYNSLKKYCPQFFLWILCMDEKTFEILQKMNLKNIKLVHLSEIEDVNLLSVKKNRNPGEYSWTCKSYLLSFILENNKDIDVIAYLDSDLYFFGSPYEFYKEFEDNSIMITLHNFPDNRKYWEETKGKYNAGVLIFKNNENAKECLNWWKKECLNWCFKKYEDGKMGDQLYLNSWNKKFPGIHDIKNIGVNLGPWSLSRYNIKAKNGEILINNYSLILFHFHALKIFSPLFFEPATGYKISKEIVSLIYDPYYIELKKVISDVKLIDSDFNFGFSKKVNFCERVKGFILNIIK